MIEYTFDEAEAVDETETVEGEPKEKKEGEEAEEEEGE